jgi:hypothetical protein
MHLTTELKQVIARKVGLSIGQLRQTNPVDIAKHIEEKTHIKLSFSSQFPFIGRGNVLRDGVITSELINKDIDSILGL